MEFDRNKILLPALAIATPILVAAGAFAGRTRDIIRSRSDGFDEIDDSYGESYGDYMIRGHVYHFRLPNEKGERDPRYNNPSSGIYWVILREALYHQVAFLFNTERLIGLTPEMNMTCFENHKPDITANYPNGLNWIEAQCGSFESDYGEQVLTCHPLQLLTKSHEQFLQFAKRLPYQADFPPLTRKSR